MKYNKLVRDKIPGIIRAKGERPVTHVADETEYFEKLRQKLREEVEEFLKSGKPEELADILEVVYALGTTAGVTRGALEQLREAKAGERGGFDGRIVLEETN